MKFIVSRNKLLKALLHCQCMIGKNAIEMFKNYLFTFEGEETMTVMASNGEMWMTEQVALGGAGKELRPVSFYYHELLKAIKTLEEQPLEFVVGEYQATVKHSTGSFRLPIMNSTEEYKEFFKSRIVPEEGGVSPYYRLEYEAPGLRSILGKCGPYMADDELRPAMNGVYMDLTKEWASYAASDGHRLMRLRKKPMMQGGEPVEMSLIMPAKTVKNLLRLLPNTGDAVLEYQEQMTQEQLKTEKNYGGNGSDRTTTNTVVLRKAVVRIIIDDTIRYYFTPVDGRYPNYNSVIPQSNSYEILTDRKLLIKSIDRLMIFAPTSGMILIDATQEQMSLTAADPDMDVDGEEKVACECSRADGKELDGMLHIAINDRLLTGVLKTMPTEKVVMKYENSSRGCIIMPVPQSDVEEVTALVMPMYDGN